MHELKVTRLVAAPPEKCWDVLVNRQEEWWCPAPWRVEIVEQQRRPGGRSAMVMLGPDGERMPQDGIYLDWVDGARFVVTDAVVRNGDGYVPSEAFMIGGWEVTPEGEGTRYTAWARHWSEETMAQHKEMGFEQGWSAVADQFAALCEGG
ncbi:SRPBCC domain-containing protein [Croceicoccus bisphenolivorans]|uniref:SRPBCC domain-containing protein n=1 Tax=Croceicoccus bisphenolivorans TaxID=1783232 RepID=UPI000835F888|nr:SRPBCC domain-containing protein [Croceicoccus bisphenolivorans]